MPPQVPSRGDAVDGPSYIFRKSKVMLDSMRLKNVATLSLHDLENMLEVAVENENYEEAAKLRDEIIKLKNQQGA